MAEDFIAIGARHGFGADATRAMVDALQRGGGRMAQFSHPELGGMGQWSAGGMIMIGDMFNNALKARIDAFCSDLGRAVGAEGTHGVSFRQQPGSANWWPAGLGVPSATGAQNDMRYACFPDQRRLAVMQHGQVHVYDTAEHRIGGFSQQQSTGQTLSFTSQSGTVRLDDLREV